MLADLFRADIAVDLGSACTRLAVRGQGAASEVASVVAIRTRRSGRREVVAFGEEARALLGRAPDDVDVIRPVRSGRVVAPVAAEALLRHLLDSLEGRRWVRRRVSLAVHPDAPRTDIRTARDVLQQAGAHEVVLVPSPLAAAYGAGLDPEARTGHMVVDVGAGTTSISVVCHGTVVTSTVLDVAGDVFDGAVIRHLTREHALLVGPHTAEHIKRTLGAATEPRDAHGTVAGRCLRAGVPRAVEVSAEGLAEALAEPVAAIGAGIRRVLEQTPAEIAGDVADHGVILVGAGARLVNLDLALRGATGLAVLLVEGGEHAVIRGAARALGTSAWATDRAWHGLLSSVVDTP